MRDCNNSNREQTARKPGAMSSHPRPSFPPRGTLETYLCGSGSQSSHWRDRFQVLGPLGVIWYPFPLPSSLMRAVRLRTRAVEFCGPSGPTSHKVLEHAQELQALLSRLPRWKWRRPTATHANLRRGLNKVCCLPARSTVGVRYLVIEQM